MISLRRINVLTYLLTLLIRITWKQTFDFLLAFSVFVVISYIISEILDLGRWNDLQMLFKVIKSGTSQKLVYDFLLVVYITFAVSRTVFEKFDVKQSNDLEISPRSSTVTSCESCGVTMYVKCSEDSERKKRKSPFSTTTFSFDAPPQGTSSNICVNLMLPETTFPGLHFCCWQYMGSPASFRTVLSESRRRQLISCRVRHRF